MCLGLSDLIRRLLVYIKFPEWGETKDIGSDYVD